MRRKNNLALTCLTLLLIVVSLFTSIHDEKGAGMDPSDAVI
jgi:hypothetical protein